MPMKRLNFHLTDDQLARLHSIAVQRDISVAELVRRLIDQGLARLGAPSALSEGVVTAELHQPLAALETKLTALLQRLEATDY
jgi:hypothetical protein